MRLGPLELAFTDLAEIPFVNFPSKPPHLAVVHSRRDPAGHELTQAHPVSKHLVVKVISGVSPYVLVLGDHLGNELSQDGDVGRLLRKMPLQPERDVALQQVDLPPTVLRQPPELFDRFVRVVADEDVVDPLPPVLSVENGVQSAARRLRNVLEYDSLVRSIYGSLADHRSLPSLDGFMDSRARARAFCEPSRQGARSSNSILKNAHSPNSYPNRSISYAYRRRTRSTVASS